MQLAGVRFVALALLSMIVAACGSGSSQPNAMPGPAVLSGLVMDGPVTGATISAVDALGHLLATEQSDDSAHFSVTIPAASAYPVVISASGGTDSVTAAAPELTLQAVAIHATQQTVNISIYSTLTVAMASHMPGGLNAANINSANGILMTAFNFGMDSAILANPMSNAANTTDIPYRILANDALAEVLRRSQSALALSGTTMDQDNLLGAIAEDLIDGHLDGTGDSNGRVAVTVLLAAGQVLVEIMDSRLMLDGSPAAPLLDAAARIADPLSTPSIADLPLLAEQIVLAQTAAHAAYMISPTTNLAALQTVLDQVNAGARSSEIALGTEANGMDHVLLSLTQVSEQTLLAVTAAVGSGNFSNTCPAGTAALISELTVNDSLSAAGWSIQTNLTSGVAMYGDRTYTLSTAAQAVTGQIWIRTANAARDYNGAEVARFQVHADADVYIAHRDDITAKPPWLNQYQDSGLDLTNDEPKTYSLWRRPVAAGSVVSLGPNGSTSSGMYIVIVLPKQTNGNAAPVAMNDSISTGQNTPVNINVLDNDSGLMDVPLTLSIVTPASQGMALVQNNHTVTYTPNPGFAGTDNFSYNVTDANGDIALGNVSITVVCTKCAAGITLKVQWNANTDPVDGYQIYGGLDGTAVNTLLRRIGVAELADPMLPSVLFSADKDLALAFGDHYCFAVKAYNTGGVSPATAAHCVTLPAN